MLNLECCNMIIFDEKVQNLVCNIIIIFFCGELGYKHLEFRYFCEFFLIHLHKLLWQQVGNSCHCVFCFNIFSIFGCFLFSASAKNKILQIMGSGVFSLQRGQNMNMNIENNRVVDCKLVVESVPDNERSAHLNFVNVSCFTQCKQFNHSLCMYGLEDIAYFISQLDLTVRIMGSFFA
jgi:hypothetical protein